MKKLTKYLNYAFEIYAPSEELIDKIEKPGTMGNWLIDPFESPDQVAIIPAPYDKEVGFISQDLLYKVLRIPLDNNGVEMQEKVEKIFLCEVHQVEETKELAKQLGCEYIYYSAWDNNRIMVIIPTEPCTNIYKDPEKVIYYDLDVNNESVTDYKSDRT